MEIPLIAICKWCKRQFTVFSQGGTKTKYYLNPEKRLEIHLKTCQKRRIE